MKPRPRSIKIKLVFFTALIVISVAASLSTFIRSAQKRILIETQETNREEKSMEFAQVAQDAILVDDETGLINYVNRLQKNPTISYAMLLSPDGKIRVHTNPYLIGTFLQDPATLKALQYHAREKPLEQKIVTDTGLEVIDLAIPVVVGGNPGELKGFARLGFNKKISDEILANKIQEVDSGIIRAMIIALILGLFGAVLLAYFMTRPIHFLKEGAKKIGEGNLKHRISINTQDELHELADDFNLMAQKLGELDEMKQDFVSNVTHELRSPMTSIRGYIDLIMQEAAGPITELQKDYLSIIKNSALRLARFIDNLLDVAKIESQKLKLTPEIHNIYEAVHEMGALFKPQLQEKHITFQNKVSPSIQKAFVDKDKLSEVLINLTSNAIKFTPENGTIMVDAKEGPNYIELSVQDSGIGIPKDMIGKLFNKFEQVKSTQGLARNQKGTGLGLTIAKGIVEAHGGKIWIESPGPSGKGTAFFFTIPKLTPEIEDRIKAAFAD